VNPWKGLSPAVEALSKSAGVLRATYQGKKKMPQSQKARARQDAIKHLRVAKGWGQQALADRAVVSIKTINSVENGKPAQLRTFSKIAKALGVEPPAFLDGYDPATRLPADAVDTVGKRVEVKLTLSIPWGDFDETEGLDRLVGLLMSLANAKNAITVTDLSPGSTKMTLLVDEEDAPRLVQAFSQGKLDAVQATELDVPRTIVLFFLAAVVAQGAANPILGLLMHLVGFTLLVQLLRKSGTTIELEDGDHVLLKRTAETLASPAREMLPPGASVDPSLIRQAIKVVTPEFLAPRFPYEIGLRLEPTEAGGVDSVRLGEQLESQLLSCQPLHGKVRRAAPEPGWTGKISIELTSLVRLWPFLERTQVVPYKALSENGVF
jgi:transcriptional regulator with XRE-family HTH domain